MSDIFISYSRKDSTHARELAEKLRAIGIKVWMDQESLTPSEQWATEVVESIHNCSAFLVLLSGTSVESHNVLKELSLASEKRKRVIPIDVDSTPLPASFQYALAGIQKVGIDDFESICTAIAKGAPRLMKRDQKPSLMVLPFEDLSPTQDNAWFADGLMSELISSLSNIKSIRIISERTSREFRNVKVKTLDIAREYDVRYFIEGSVRKFGEQIKISLQLLDTQEGENVWTYIHKGVFADIFEMEEEVARKVVAGLKLKLTTEEEKKIEDKGTESAEAYELYIKSREFGSRRTRDGFLHEIALLSEALILDPNFAEAMNSKSDALSDFYDNYDRKKEYLDDAELFAKKALALKPNLWAAYNSLSLVYLYQGKYKEAEEIALEYVRHAPDDVQSHFSLAYVYQIDHPEKAIASYETAIRLKPDDLTTYFNLVTNCDQVGNREKGLYWATEALPHFEKHLKFKPDDENRRVQFATLLLLAGQLGAAQEYLASMGELRDGHSLYNMGCTQLRLKDYGGAAKSLLRSVDAGFYFDDSLTDPELKVLHDFPEFKEMVIKLEDKKASIGRPLIS